MDRGGTDLSLTEEPGMPRTRLGLEGELRESNELYRLLAEHSTDMISKHTPEGVYTYASPASRSLLGYDPEDLVGRDAYEFLHPDDLEEIQRTHSAILERPDTYTVAYRIRRKDGSYTWFETTSRTVRDPETDEVLEIITVSRDITERKSAEARLREAEAKYRTLVEQIPAVTYVAALDDVASATYVSPQVEEVLGTVPEEWLADPELVVKLLHPEDRKRVRLEHARANRRGVPLKLEYRLTARDGRVVWARDESVVVRDDVGRPLFRQGIVLDVTDHKEAEGRMLFQTHLLEQVQAAIIATDMRGKVTHWNEHAERLYGWSREEALGRAITELTVGPGEVAAAEEIMEALRTGGTWEGEFVVRRKDGSTFPAHVTDSLIRDAEGRPVGMVGVSTDITVRRRTEQELRESEARFRAFFETAAVGAAHADPATGRFLQVNAKLCRFLGYGRDELLSMTFSDVTHPDDRARDLEGLSRLLRGDIREYAVEKRYVRKDGQTVWGQLAVSLVRDANGRALHTVAITRDITQRKRLEESLREIREAERRRIARDLHDVVLQDLAGALQGMQAAQVESAGSGLDQEITALRRAVGSLRIAIYDLRLEKDQPFVRAVESLVELNRQLTPERAITLTVADGFPPELPGAADVELLRVLQEALVNARRHSDARCVEVTLSVDRREVRAEVADDGLGFDPSSVRKGVGLAGMRERASALGGRLEIESGPGEGTSVRVEVSFSASR
jgi:PAS domain S-box-containing protein